VPSNFFPFLSNISPPSSSFLKTPSIFFPVSSYASKYGVVLSFNFLKIPSSLFLSLSNNSFEGIFDLILIYLPSNLSPFLSKASVLGIISEIFLYVSSNLFPLLSNISLFGS